MTGLATLATARRWRLTREPGDGSVLGDPIVQGRRGSLWDDAPGRLGLSIQATSKVWRSARRQGLAAGFVVSQDGDCEGALSFSASDPAQVRLAARLAGIRPKRQLSPSHREKLARSSVAHRFGSVLSGGSGPQAPRLAAGGTATPPPPPRAA